MKSRYKISIAIVAIVVGIYVVLPPTWTVILCDDQILNIDNCVDYLQEKYSKLPMFKHFAETYPDAEGLYITYSRFNAESVIGSSTLDDKVFAILAMNLNDSTFHYACQNHNLGDDYVVIELENTTMQDMDGSNCMVLNQLGEENEE